MAPLQGVYSAVVVDNRDPRGIGRVKIRIAAGAKAPGGDELWARMATTMAGKNRGTWFMPDPGDEVLVVFEQGDPRVPYVIGGLWNTEAPPPEGVDDSGGNTVKLIRSRNGVTLRMRDDADKDSLTIETPAGQRITLKDGPGTVTIEDAGGNSVTLSPSGIIVNASAKVTIRASAVELATGMMTVNAGMSRFNGVIQCDTLISNAVVSAS